MKNCFRLSGHFGLLKNMFNSLMIKNRTALSSNYFTNLSKKASNPIIDKKEHSSLFAKPPNVLVFGSEPSMQMQDCVKCIEACLATSCYAVYPISTAKFLTDPWPENTNGLIILNSHFQTSYIAHVKAIIEKYLLSGGKVLNFSPYISDYIQISKLLNFVDFFGKLTVSLQSCQKKIDLHVSTWSGSVIDCNDNDKSLVCSSVSDTLHCLASFDDEKHSIFCTLPLLPFDISDSSQNFVVLSYLLHCLGLESKWNNQTEVADVYKNRGYPAFLYVTDLCIQKEFFQKIFNEVQGDIPLKAPGLKFVSASSSQSFVLDHSDSDLTVTYSEDVNSLSSYNHCFDWNTYKNALSTQNYGKLVVYGDVLPTTMDVFDGILSKLSINLSPIAIAKQQTKGKGRGGNKWLSPSGCAMFTLIVHVPIHSQLGMALPFLQHLTAVAVVHSIRSAPGLQDVDLRVKWPNDVYFGSSVKLGGVIVKSTLYQDVCIASIGCGVNISNLKPTVCVNDILKEEYAIDRKLKCEEVIAKTVSCLELLINNFQQSGPESFIQLYYKYWLHSNCEVTIEVDGSSVPCTIVGIDEFGFLRARCHENGAVLSLHPDGNSFDIMKNLIVPKST